MANDIFRFVGFAFATADFLFEIDGQGLITFAAGAGRQIAGADNAALVGRDWRDLFDPVDRPTAAAVLEALEDGERRGPIELQLAPVENVSRLAGLSMFRLPSKPPRTSCAMSLSHRKPKARIAPGVLQTREEFENVTRGLIEAARLSGAELELGLVEFAGLLAQ
ncbi:MAG TPA: PAS domain-containing protein, partial [Caulobacteraceae bacterium]|nr:PAS domain-containing protein [Caulobacteraceae bacterium]